MHSICTRPNSILRLAGWCAGVGLSLCTASAMAAASVSSDIQARYEQERALCLSGRSNQDQATCLREAAAARDAARRGQLDDGLAAQYQRNAKARCAALTGDDAVDCIARMEGQGTTSGSVAGGGVLRELRKIVPADTPGATPQR